MDNLRDKIEDWMVRVTYAESGQPEDGFELTGEKLQKKIRVALDKLVVARSEQSGTPAIAGDAAPAAGPEKDESAGATAARDPSAPLRVMLVDDEPIVGKRLGPALRKYGIEVEYFCDATEALERLGEQQFDVVVTDYMMEEVNGLQILERVMATCPSTRVIMITGFGSVEVARDALSKGAFDFISKPFKPAELRSVVNKAALSLGFEAQGG